MAFIAILLLNVGWFVQIGRVIERKSSDDISLANLIIMISGFVLLQTYTFVAAWDPIYAISNFVGLFGVVSMMVVTIKYRTTKLYGSYHSYVVKCIENRGV